MSAIRSKILKPIIITEKEGNYRYDDDAELNYMSSIVAHAAPGRRQSNSIQEGL